MKLMNTLERHFRQIHPTFFSFRPFDHILKLLDRRLTKKTAKRIEIHQIIESGVNLTMETASTKG
jgi:hypothetical protein